MYIFIFKYLIEIYNIYNFNNILFVDIDIDI